MRAIAWVVLGAGAATLGGGCSSGTPRLSAAQLQALETRTVDASKDEVLGAAATAMLDEGLLFSLSDPEAGLLAASGHIGAGAMEHGGAPGFASNQVLLWVRPAGAHRSEVRVRLATGPTEQGVTRVVTAIERRLPGAVGGVAAPKLAGGGR